MFRKRSVTPLSANVRVSMRDGTETEGGRGDIERQRGVGGHAGEWMHTIAETCRNIQEIILVFRFPFMIVI